jgi:hypothetical protein
VREWQLRTGLSTTHRVGSRSWLICHDGETRSSLASPAISVGSAGSLEVSPPVTTARGKPQIATATTTGERCHQLRKMSQQ